MSNRPAPLAGPAAVVRTMSAPAATRANAMIAAEVSSDRSNALDQASAPSASAEKKTAPTTAIPAAEPIRCPVCNIPAPLPAWGTGTSDRVSVWLGAITRPLPMPATSSGSAVTQGTGTRGTSSMASAARPRPVTTATSPMATSGRPYLLTSRPPTADATAEPSANGVIAAPATSAL
ncbi:hypothetical protein GCM10029963_08870 [Micromonospora andamanensis]